MSQCVNGLKLMLMDKLGHVRSPVHGLLPRTTAWASTISKRKKNTGEHSSSQAGQLLARGMLLPGAGHQVLMPPLAQKRIPHILSSCVHLNTLTRLYLISSKLDENSFTSLTMLRNLCFLALCMAYDGKTLCFSAQSFPRSRKLQVLGALPLNQVEIEEDALGSLVTLCISECPKLKRFPQWH